MTDLTDERLAELIEYYERAGEGRVVVSDIAVTIALRELQRRRAGAGEPDDFWKRAWRSCEIDRAILEGRNPDFSGLSGKSMTGWKLVPIEPTNEMLLNGWRSNSAMSIKNDNQLVAVYRGMISDTPWLPLLYAHPPAASDADRRDAEQVIAAARALADWMTARAGQPNESFALKQALKAYDAAIDAAKAGGRG